MDDQDASGDIGATPHARETLVAQGRFLEALARTGNVSAAARETGTHRATHHGWVQTSPAYAENTRDAMEMFRDSLRDEITRRARDGWDEPVRWDNQGNVTATVRKYSDRMLELQAKALMPEYRDGVKAVDGASEPSEQPLSWDEQREARQALERARVTGDVPS